MAITLRSTAQDATTWARTTSATAVETGTDYTISAGSDVYVVGVADIAHFSAPPTISSIQWDSAGTPESLTSIGDFTQDNNRVSIRGRAPTITAGKMELNLSGSASDIAIGLYDFTGVDTSTHTSPTTPTTGADFGTAVACAELTISSGSYAIDIYSTDGAPTISAQSHSPRFSDVDNTRTASQYTLHSTDASPTFAYTASSSESWYIMAVEIKEAAVSGLGIPLAAHHYKMLRG